MDFGTRYQVTLQTNWSSRAFRELKIWPAVGVEMFIFGLPKPVLLKALKNSNRVWRFTRSVMRVFFSSERSQLLSPGPSKNRVPEFGIVPVGATTKALLSNHRLLLL